MYIWKPVCIICTLCTITSGFLLSGSYRAQLTHRHAAKRFALHMALDSFIKDKLSGIQRTFHGLTERLSDPDVANNPSLLQTVSQVRQFPPARKTEGFYDRIVPNSSQYHLHTTNTLKNVNY